MSSAAVGGADHPSGRASAAAFVWGQGTYAIEAFVRTRASVVLALGLPLAFLVIFGLLAGNETIDAAGGVRVAQYLAPVAAVFAVAMITFSALPTGVARERERGILKRLHGTPLPWSAYLVGRIAAAVVISLVGVAILLAVGVIAYDVQLLGRTAAAVFVTLVVGIACFASLGLAAVALLRSSTVVEAVTSGSVMILGFISGIVAVGTDMPLWLERLGWVFPLKHVTAAMTDACDPFLPGAGFSPEHLAAMAAWGVVGLLVAVRFFRWEPPRTSAGAAGRTARGAVGAAVAPRSTPRVVVGQVRYADAVLWRDPGAWFWALAFPVLLLVLMPVLFGEEARIGELSLAEHLAAGMPVYAIAVVAYVVQASAVAKARDRGVLKRLAGTPLPGWAYVAGRIGSTLWLSVAATVVMLALAAGLYGVEIRAAAIPALALAVLVGSVSLGALGLALAALVPQSKSVDAIALGTLLPLAMLSGVFPIDAPFPAAVASVMSWLPLSPFRQAVADALASTTSPNIAWASLAVLAAWGVASALVASRLLRADAQAGRGAARWRKAATTG
jgi:ABC-type multidrug transport system permease subunit